MITKKEAYNIIVSNAGVLTLMGKPGTGKTAMLESIARENGWRFYAFVLPEKNEEDIAGFPQIVERVDKNGYPYNVMVNTLKDTFYDATNARGEYPEDQHALILFDEPNRAPQRVLNTMLAILNERRLDGITFGPNVHFAMSQNLGAEDGTNVNADDSAIADRQVRIEWDPSYRDWKEMYGNKNVNKYILSFLNTYPEFSYNYKPGIIEDEGNYATFRSWSYLSKFIEHHKLSTAKEILECIQNISKGWIGKSAAAAFNSYLEDIDKITWEDVLTNKGNSFDKFESLDPAICNSILLSIPHKNLQDVCLDLNISESEMIQKIFRICKSIDDRGFSEYSFAFFNKIHKDVNLKMFVTDTIYRKMFMDPYVSKMLK